MEDLLQFKHFEYLKKRGTQFFVAIALLALAPTAFADEISAGDTAWMLTATALVLFMTIPGLRCFTPVWSARRTCCPS